MLKRRTLLKLAAIFAAALILPATGQDSKPAVQTNSPIPAGSRVFVAPIEGGFDKFLIAGLLQKQVPVTVVTDKSKADYEISGFSESKKAGWAKMLFLMTEASHEQATIKVAEAKTGEVVFTYSVNKSIAIHGKQSAGEDFAKHLVMLSSSAPIPAPKNLPPGSKVFVAPMNGFETYLKTALSKKHVSLVVLESKDKADFEITGHSESQKASTAKKLILWEWQSREEAAINVTNIKTGEVVFAYAALQADSTHGRRSTAESCAKHLKQKIEAR